MADPVDPVAIWVGDAAVDPEVPEDVVDGELVHPATTAAAIIHSTIRTDTNVFFIITPHKDQGWTRATPVFS